MALKATGGSAENRPLVRAVMRADATVYVMSLVLVAVAFVLRSLLAPTLSGQALYLLLLPPCLLYTSPSPRD